MSAIIKSDTEGIWRFFTTMGVVKSETDHASDDIKHTLEKLEDRISKDIKRTEELINLNQDEILKLHKQQVQVAENGKDESVKEKESKIVSKITNLEAKNTELMKHEENLRFYKKKISDYQLELGRMRKLYSRNFNAARKMVNRYLLMLEIGSLSADYENYKEQNRGNVDKGSFQGTSFSTRFTVMSFRGIDFFCDNTSFNINQIDALGRTNLQRMERGVAPIGQDGLSINLHHMLQSDTKGSMMELLKSTHSKNHKVLHTNTNDIPSGVDRVTFGYLKRAYWKRRVIFIKMEQEN